MKQSNQSELNFLDEFRNFIIASKKGKRVKKDGSKLQILTLKKLEARYNLLKSFSEQKQFQLRIKILQKNQRQINTEKVYWRRFYLKFTDFLFKDLDCYIRINFVRIIFYPLEIKLRFQLF